MSAQTGLCWHLFQSFIPEQQAIEGEQGPRWVREWTLQDGRSMSEKQM